MSNTNAKIFKQQGLKGQELNFVRLIETIIGNNMKLSLIVKTVSKDLSYYTI